MRLSLAYEVCIAKKMGLCKKEREAFYNLRPIPTLPLQPWPLNGGSQPKDCNPTTSPQYFVLGFVLIFFHVPSCLNPRRYSPNPRRYGSSQRALTNPLNGHIFCKRRNLPNPRVPLDS
jgi:hypothetical protein